MGLSRSIRLITYSEEIINGEPIYVSSNSLPNKAVNFEPAGHAFHNVALKLSGCFEDEESKDENQESVKKKDQEQAHSFDSYSNKGKKKSGSGEKQQDHYALLGLSHLRYLATEEQIRKAYRDAALRHHPDKQASLVLAEDTEEAKQVKKDEIETRFKAIQESYEVLMDPTRRRIYDSTDEFDDEIPTDCSPQEFFKVFGPAFLRNGRWSVQQPAPMLGDDNTPFNDVDKFYDFWYSFKSWREFPHADEFDVEQAESRDHKRWMERQNAKLSEKARKEETTRIRTLVDNAYKKDPRIVRRKEEEKAEKQRKKEAKIMAKKLQEEEAARVALEEKLKKEEDDKKAAEAALQNKKLKEKEKKLLRKERSRFRTLANSVVSNNLLDLTDSHVESICAIFTLEQLKALNDKIEASNDGLEKAKLIRECDVKQETLKENGGSETKPIALASNSYQKKEKIWSKEEIELLRKAIVKYPKGTSRRWEVVSEFIGTGRSVEEILKATKTVLLQKPDSNKAFDSFLEKRKAAPVIASPLSTRDDEVSVTKPVTEQTSNVTVSVPVNVNVTVNEVSSSSDQDVWSAVQERALVQALKTFPKETSQRWERVATAVPGKTVNQCKKKFTLLKESFRNKKTGV